MSTVCMHTVQDWTLLTFIVWTKKKKNLRHFCKISSFIFHRITKVLMFVMTWEWVNNDKIIYFFNYGGQSDVQSCMKCQSATFRWSDLCFRWVIATDALISQLVSITHARFCVLMISFHALIVSGCSPSVGSVWDCEISS